MSEMKMAFDIENRGYHIRAYWDESSAAKVTIHKGDELFKEFGYPAYKIFNLAAHFSDIVDGITSCDGVGHLNPLGFSLLKQVSSKWVECLKCGWVGRVSKHIPIKQAWCGQCKSPQLRLWRSLTKRAAD